MTFQGLKTIDLNLSGNLITVSEASNAMAEKRGEIVAELLEYNLSPAGKKHPHSNVVINIYSGLMACSTGDLPATPAAYRNEMKDADTQAWLDAARKLNPHWFAWMVEVEQELSAPEAKKKKGKTTRK